MKNKNLMFVLFGVTGDLSKRKLIPAIYNLSKNKKIKKFHIVGISRRDFTSEKIINSSEEFIKNPDPLIIKNLIKNTTYISADFNSEKDYKKIESGIKKIEKNIIYDKIFYLATGSNNFESISQNLNKIKITKEKGSDVKVVYEKPFGSNLATANKLNKCIKKIFNEKQIYRIDHYLGKETVESISVFRFSNIILEPIWNKKYIDNIQIILDEDIGIDERGPYYDKYGVVRDMVQNHMLQVLALLTMEEPKSFSMDYVRNEKAKLLKNVKIKDTLLAQYIEYTSEKGIPKNSTTPTFAAHRLEINNSRWRGVPIFFRTGKFLKEKQSKVIINFKKIKCLFEYNCPTNGNSLEIKFSPKDEFIFNLNSKKPGEKYSTPIQMNFCSSCLYGDNTPKGYENLFSDIINGNQTDFTREDELQNAWRVVDKIKNKKLYKYKKGSSGPKEMKIFNKKNGVVWK